MQAACRARLDGAEGHLEALRDLPLGQVAVVGQLDGLPLGCGQLGEGPVQPVAVGEVVAVGAAVPPGRVAHGVQRHGVRRACPQVVDGPLARDADHPGRQAPRRVEPVPAAPHLGEHDLQHVLDVLGGHEPPQVGADQRGVLAVTVAERSRLAPGEAGSNRVVHAPPHPIQGERDRAVQDHCRAGPPRKGQFGTALTWCSLTRKAVIQGTQRCHCWHFSPNGIHVLFFVAPARHGCAPGGASHPCIRKPRHRRKG